MTWFVGFLTVIDMVRADNEDLKATVMTVKTNERRVPLSGQTTRAQATPGRP